MYGSWKLWERPCVLCGLGAGHVGLCTGCREDLPRAADPPCPARLGSLRAAFEYRFPVDELVQAAKFESNLAVLHACGMVLCEEVSASLPTIDVLVPIPLGRWRYARRAYNQAVEMARPLAARLGCPLDAGGLARRRDRVPQSALDAVARRRNIAGAFAARHRFDRCRVLLVDDVVTTGATLNAAARALLAAGASAVHAVAFASASPP